MDEHPSWDSIEASPEQVIDKAYQIIELLEIKFGDKIQNMSPDDLATYCTDAVFALFNNPENLTPKQAMQAAGTVYAIKLIRDQRRMMAKSDLN